MGIRSQRHCERASLLRMLFWDLEGRGRQFFLTMPPECWADLCCHIGLCSLLVIGSPSGHHYLCVSSSPYAWQLAQHLAQRHHIIGAAFSQALPMDLEC